jgi:hypothetical protein
VRQRYRLTRERFTSASGIEAGREGPAVVESNK